jgi:hypothetical protein
MPVRLPPDGMSRVPTIVPVMVAPLHTGKQLDGPVTVPEMMPVTMPELGRLTASTEVNMPLKIPVTGILLNNVMLSLPCKMVMVPTKLPTMLTLLVDCWLGLVPIMVPVRMPVMFPSEMRVPG